MRAGSMEKANEPKMKIDVCKKRIDKRINEIIPPTAIIREYLGSRGI
jgi:hypothetical protein